MANKVTADRILIAEVRMFDYYENGMLHEIELPESVALRAVIFMDGEVIDLATKTPLSHINYDENGYVIPEIYKDTMYIEQLYKHPNIDKNLMKLAQGVYEYYLFMKELKESHKVLEFPKARLY